MLNQSEYRTGQFQEIQEVESPKISRHSANEGNKFEFPTHRPSLTKRKHLVLISVRC